MPSKEANLLLVEDDEVDIMAIRLSHHRIQCHLIPEIVLKYHVCYLYFRRHLSWILNHLF